MSKMLHDGKAGEKGKLITQLPFPLFFLFGISPENAAVEEFAMFFLERLSLFSTVCFHGLCVCECYITFAHIPHLSLSYFSI